VFLFTAFMFNSSRSVQCSHCSLHAQSIFHGTAEVDPCIRRIFPGYVDVCRNSAGIPLDYNSSRQSSCQTSMAYLSFQASYLRKLHRYRPAHIRKNVAKPR